MIGLVRAEMRRLVSRRFHRLLLALIVAGMVVSAIVTFAQASKDPGTALAKARQEVSACEQERARVTAAKGPRSMETFSCPSLNDAIAQFDRRFYYSRTIHDRSRGVAIALSFAAVIAAASFAGAEWGTGSMTTLLTWEPRRARVLAARTIAAVSILAAASAVLLAFFALIYLPIAEFRGVTTGMSAGWWRGLAGIWGRCAGLAAITATIGLAVAMLVRNTAGAIGITILYGGPIDPLVGAWSHGRLRAWVLHTNIARFIGFPVQVQQHVPAGTIVQQRGLPVPDFLELRVLPPWRPALLLSLYAGTLLLAAYVSFRARDVT